MAKPVVLITLGAVAGAVVGVIDGGGGFGHDVADKILDGAAAIVRSVEPDFASYTPARAAEPGGDAHLVFSTCLRSSGENVERTLRDLLEFHEHDATVSLVSCLLEGDPRRFCAPEGRKQAADAMEIYLWSRDDARRTSPAHGLADKIRMLDRAAQSGEPARSPDPFELTWSGPRDVALYDKLKGLVRQGYLEPGAFAFSGRAELREAVHDVKPEATPCVAVAGR
ncbi:MAG: hypothetical protein KGM15_06355 [Pseudomonadota bacterium]|nr:hypothetical protein [Pseudomonadota bacterium]